MRQRSDDSLADMRERLEAYELAFEIGGVGAWIWDVRTERLRWSRQLELITGLAPGRFDGRYDSFLALIHPDDVEAYRKGVRLALAGERPLDVEFRLRRADDAAERWMHTTAVVLRDDDGDPVRLVGNQTDITDRRRTDLRLRETTGLLEYVLETSPIVVFAGAVRDGRFVPEFVSGSSERVQGWSAAAFQSGAVRWEDLLHPDDAHDALAANERALAEGHSEWETRLRRPDGSYGYVRSVLRVAPDESGRLSYVGLSIDITESRRIEERLRRAQKLEAVGQLAGGVAHDFNNLLLAIAGYTETARAAVEPGGEVDRALAEVERAAHQGSTLVRQLLTFSRQQELRPVDVEVVPALSAMRELLATTAGEDVRLAVDLDPRCGWVRLGSGQLEQVVLNLVVNARDAMPAGGRLTVAAAPVEVGGEGDGDGPSGGSYVRLTVADTGQGMSREVRDHIFEPFFTTKPTGKGTGLGLATVYGIVSKAGGHVGITSAPSAGTRVELHLPRHDPPAAASATVARPVSATAGEALPRAGTLLLVEDQPQLRALLGGALERMGYKVLTAPGGDEALALVDREQPDLALLITDVVMPGLRGPAVAEQLKTRYPDLGVLFLSGYADLPDQPISGDGFLQKPFSLQELSAEVTRILAR